MIEALEKLDKRTAVGVLARAALALESEGNPAAQVRIEGEEGIRFALWREAHAQLGIRPEDNRPETIERIGEWLDGLSERMIGPTDTQSALTRLAERGDLPSDLYQLKIVENVLNINGSDPELTGRLVEQTIRSPDREQHYGLPETPNDPALISLFSRSFKTPWPVKDFQLLVAAQRGDGLLLNVNQAWRVYPFLVNVAGVGSDLVKTLSQFADVYGANIKYGDRTGHFFVFANEPVPSRSFAVALDKGANLNVSGFEQVEPETGQRKAALVVSIDLRRYQADLRRMAVKASQITPYRSEHR